jgi:hypothetical protein
MVRDIKVDEGVQELTITLLDPKKEVEYKLWDAKAKADLIKNRTELATRLPKYKTEAQAKLDGVYSGEEKTFALPEGVRVRTTKPVVLDKEGNVKDPAKVTPKEVNALRAPGTRLPGYKAQVTALRAGQIVQIQATATDLAGNAATLTTLHHIRVQPRQPRSAPRKRRMRRTPFRAWSPDI